MGKLYVAGVLALIALALFYVRSAKNASGGTSGRSSFSNSKGSSQFSSKNSLEKTDSYDGVPTFDGDAKPPKNEDPFKLSRNDVCKGWCSHDPRHPVLTQSVNCATSGIDRLKASFQMENCPAAIQAVDNARDVAYKIRKVSEENAFVFFRGAAGFFDWDLMCSDEQYLQKKVRLFHEHTAAAVVGSASSHSHGCIADFDASRYIERRLSP